MGTVKKVSAIKKIVRSKAFPLLILLLLLIGLFTVTATLNDARFFTLKRFMSILQDLAVPGFLTIGAGCLIVSGSIDISQSAAGALAGVLVAVGVAWWGLPWYLAAILGLALAGVVGLCNALLVNELRFQPFIATMAMAAILRAVMMLLCTDAGGQVQGVINFNSDPLTTLGTYKLFDRIPAASLVMVIMFVIYGLMLAKSKFGRTIYLVGGNPAAARLAGINSKRMSYVLFINCSLLSGLAGLIYSARVKQGGMAALATDQFTGLTAAILGGISFGGGAGGMGGAFVGLLVIRTFNMGMTTSGASPYMTSVLSGALLLAALTFDYFSLRRQQKRVGA